MAYMVMAHAAPAYIVTVCLACALLLVACVHVHSHLCMHVHRLDKRILRLALLQRLCSSSTSATSQVL